MDRQTGRTSGHTRSRSEDLRHQPQGRRNQRSGVRYIDETQKLIKDDKRQPTGRSRSPGRQDNRRNTSRHTSPHRRHGSEDLNGSRVRGRSQSPSGRRRDRDQSPHGGRNKTVQFQSPNQSINSQRHSFHEGQDRNTSGTQSPHKSKGNTRQNQQPDLTDRNRGRSRSPRRGPSRAHKTVNSPQLKTLDPRILDAETATARLAVSSIILHIIAIGASLMVIVPVSLVTSRWQTVREICPLYVHNNIGYHVDWGNPVMMTCNLTAFLPIIILVISFILILLLYGMLQTWYTNGTPPDFVLTRKYAVCTMLLAFVEAVVAWLVACILTDGFRQTCLSFALTPAPEDRPISCKYGFVDRDETYMFEDLNTFQKLIIALFGSWLCAIATTILAISSMIRLCCCYSK